MNRIFKLVLVLLIVCLAAGIANAGSLIAAGYNCHDTEITMAPGAFIGGFDVLPGGDFVINDGRSIRVVSYEGVDKGSLFTFDKPVYGSFVRYNNGKLYFGESSAGRMWTMSLNGDSAISLLTLPSNFDLDFRGDTPWIVADNSIYKLDEANKTLTQMIQMDGYSGPIAFDAAGNLSYSPSYYPDGTAIFQWTSAQLDGIKPGNPLLKGDASLLANLTGSYGMTYLPDGSIVTTNNTDTCLNLFDGGSVSTLATFNDEIGMFPFLTFTRYNKEAKGISTTLSWYDEDFNSHTVIATLVTPEPSSIMALCSLIGLAASARLLRRGK